MSGYHESFYTQAIGQMPTQMPEPAIGSHAMVPTGSYYGPQQGEHLQYPNEPGSPQYSGYGAMGYGDLTSYDMFPYGQTLENGNGGEEIQTFVPEDQPAPPPQQATVNPALRAAAIALGWAGAIGGAYHGYKRNQSYGWAIGWSIFGSFLPFLAIPIALAQGFGKRKVGR